MAVKVPSYKPMNNVTIANAIRNEASNDYRSRVPVATQANIRQNLESMYKYGAGRNEFVPALINKIGMTLVLPYLYQNGLAEFKRGFLANGDTVEEVLVGLAKAHTYDPTREYGEETLFGIEALDVQTSYHKITRAEFYKVTINDAMLKRAFLSDDGLWEFVAQLMASAANADNADEFTQTLALFTEYYRLGGFFKLQVPNISTPTSDAADAKTFMRTVRAIADTVTLKPTPHYNAAKMPIVTKKEELMLFTTPEAKAAMDVEALAAMFNVPAGEVPLRIVLVPAEDVADIPGFQGILTTKDYFVMYDTLIETREQQNAAGLYNNYFFHHQGITSASRFTTAILLTTEEGDIIDYTATPVTGINPIEVYDVETKTVVTSLSRGKRYLAVGSAVTEGVNNGVEYEIISGANGPLSPYTRIFQSGGIELSADETSTSLIVRQTALDTPGVLKLEKTYPIVSERVSVWPLGIFPDDDNDGLTEVIPKAPKKVGAVVTIPTVEGVQYKQAGVDVAAGNVTLTASTVFTAVATAGHEIKTGATATWTLAP